MLATNLSKGEFATVGASFGLVAFISSPLIGIVLLTSRKVTFFKQEGSQQSFKKFLNLIIFVSLSAGLLLIIIFWPFLNLLHLELKTENSAVILMILILLATAPLNSVLSGALQGAKLFKVAALSTIAVAVLRFFFAYLFISAGGAILSPFAANLVAQSTFIILILYVLFKQNFSTNDQGLILEQDGGNFSKSFIFSVLISGIAVNGLTQLDVFIVNQIFSSDIAGMYLACAILAKVMLYLPNSMTYVLYPLVAQRKGEKISGSGVIKFSLTISTLITVIILLCFYFAENHIMALTYGSKYGNSDGILFYVGLAIAPISLVLMIEHFFIAKGFVFIAWLLILFMPLEISLIYFTNASIFEVIEIMIIVNFSLLICSLLSIVFILNRDERRLK